MRETKFIEQNKDKWLQFESEMNKKHKDPELLKDLFIQITDDLSFSRTFYPNRSVRVYLNSLAQRIFFRIYRGDSGIGRRLGRFWLDGLPQVIFEARRDFLLSFFVFALAFGIGMLSSAIEPTFLRTILGDGYVNQTIENIESGDPMAIYKDRDRFGMSMGITINNLYVALLTFVLGILAGVGSMALMLTNGIMIGAFQYFFIERGLFWESFLTVWIHGTLEVSAIIIAGAAGITMGRGLAFPGTFTRMHAFQQSARRGLKILIGIVPVIILAGFIEGYLTRHTDTPDLIRGLFIAVCLFFVLTYFVWYPRFRAKIGFDSFQITPDLPPDTQLDVDYSRIKSSGDLFADVFLLIRKYGARIFHWSAGTGLAYTLILSATASKPLTDIFFFPEQAFGKLQVIGRFFYNPDHPGFPLVMGISLALLASFTGGIIRTERRWAISYKAWWTRAAMSLLPISFGLLIMATQDWYTFFILAFTLPLPLLFLSNLQLYGRSMTQTWGQARHLIPGNYWRSLGLFLMLMMICFIFFALLDTVLLLFYLNLVNLFIYLPPDQMDILMVILEAWITSTAIFFLVGIVFIGFHLQVFSLEEIRNATDLRKRIQKIEIRPQIKGLSKE